MLSALNQIYPVYSGWVMVPRSSDSVWFHTEESEAVLTRTELCELLTTMDYRKQFRKYKLIDLW